MQPDRAHLLTLLSTTLPPSVVDSGATVHAMRAGQWSHDAAEPDDRDDDDEAETAIADRPTPKPLLDAAAVIAECREQAIAYRERIGGNDTTARWAYQVGLLNGHLTKAEVLINALLAELQTAVDETCNSYHRAGHFERVQRLYGITEAVQA